MLQLAEGQETRGTLEQDRGRDFRGKPSRVPALQGILLKNRAIQKPGSCGASQELCAGLAERRVCTVVTFLVIDVLVVSCAEALVSCTEIGFIFRSVFGRGE